ncbi:MAG: tetratricopeptide repeat protein [Anaeromyxobacteraceae bacterium]
MALLAVLAAHASPTAAADPSLVGEWESSVGRIRIEAKGALLTGKLVGASGQCRFEEGSEVLKGTLLDDSFAGRLRICLRGVGCRAKEEWASVVLLAASGALSGAVHVEARGCVAPAGKNGGITLRRATGPTPPLFGAIATPAAREAPAANARPKDDKRARRAKARTIMKDGAAYLREGSFEAARRRFLEAIEIDEGIPEAYNGVGVTWRMRNDLARALEWYKKALVVDPDFGDAYYNMACVYSLQGQKELALRYLQIAALNGYATADGIGADPDLAPLRADPAYDALVRAKM